MTIKLPFKVCILLCALSKAILTFGQSETNVKGRVTEKDGTPIVGVTVIQKGKSGHGCITDQNGDFTLRVTGENPVLVFTHVAYASVSEPVNNKTWLDVKMQDFNQLDDVVVIGFGSAKRGDLTGSISSVKADIFDNRMTTSMADALRGQIAGVKILSQTGEPGEELNIRIRGSGSLNASNSPIYVIDGIMMERADVSPGDIQSIDILKDASATAIYGAKGANGVVMITTKRGVKGKPKVEISVSSSYQTPVRLLDLMDSYEFAKMLSMNSYTFFKKGSSPDFNSGGRKFYYDSEGNIWRYTPGDKWAANQQIYKDPSNPGYVNSDWQRAMMRNVWTTDVRANFSGGDDKNTYSVMGGYFYQPGILLNSDYERYNLRSNYERKINEKGTKFGLNVSGTRSEQTGLLTGNGGVTMSMLMQAPTKPLSSTEWIAEGSESIDENYNPLYQAKSIKRKYYVTNINLRTFFDIAIYRGLVLKLAATMTNVAQASENYFPKDVAQGLSVNGKAVNNTTQNFRWNTETFLVFNPRLAGPHKFDLMGGFVAEQLFSKNFNATTQNFLLEGLGANSMQDGITLASTTTNHYKTRMASFLGRMNYSYTNRYLFTATIRADGCSLFGPDNKWGIFPSAAFAWRISEERWLKNVNAVSNLKLRLSVGATGNAGIPSLQSLDIMQRVLYPIDGQNPGYGIWTTRPANPDLKWESTIQYNAGVDFGFFKNRLTGTVEIFYKQIRDLLFEQPVPYSQGYEKQWSNIASVDNKGLEITLKGIAVNRKNVFWSIDYNMTFLRSKVLSLGGASELILTPQSSAMSTNFGILRVGKPLGNWYGYQTAGIWRHQSQIDALPDNYSSIGVSKDNMRPGYIRYVDQNNDGTINEKDRVILGCSEPLFTGGLSHVVRYKNFTLTANFEYSVGGKIFNATARDLTQLNSNGAKNQLASAANYWRPTLYDMTTGEIVDPGNETSNIRMPVLGWDKECTDQFIEDASYLRLDNVSLVYNVPKKISNKLKLSKWSFSFSIRNLFVWTKYTGYDPDVNVGGNIYTDLLPKLDAGSFPRPRTFTIGTNIVF